MKLTRRPQFVADIEECADYLATEAGESVAHAWREALKECLRLMLKFPEIGRLRQDLPVPGIRTLHLRKYPNYLVFYRLEADTIELLRVRHGMMHLPALFKDESSGD